MQELKKHNDNPQASIEASASLSENHRQSPEIRAGVHLSPPTLIESPLKADAAMQSLLREGLTLDIGDASWQEIDSALQAGYFGPFKDKLRAEITALHPIAAEGPVVEQFRAAGYIDEIHAPLKQYDHAILPGATAAAVQSRLNYLVQEYTEHGVSFETCFFLGGNRPLFDSEIETLKEVLGSDYEKHQPKTEADMMELLWEYSDLPEDFRANVKPIFVNAIREDGRNPNTEDTVKAMIEKAESLGYSVSDELLLVASSNPFVSFQTKATLNVLLESGIKPQAIHGIGYAANEKQQSVYNLDNNLAKDVNQALRLEKNSSP